MTKADAEFVGQVKEAINEMKSDARESRKVVNDTKDTLIRVETLMENVVTKPEMYKAFNTHRKEDHKPKKSKFNYGFWGGVAAGGIFIAFGVFKLVTSGAL